MIVDPSTLNPWIVYLTGLFVLAKTIWELFTRPGSKAQEAVEKLAEIVGKKASAEMQHDLERRVTAIETVQATTQRDFAHLPDKDAMHRIEMELQKLTGSMGVFEAQLKPVAASVSRIQDLLDEKVKL